jgi:hypothetical protein
MEIKIKRETDSMERVDLFGKREDVTLTPKLSGLFTNLGTKLTQLRNWGSSQVSGEQGQSAGVVERRLLVKDIRGDVREIADIAKSMEEEGQVGMAELFRYPRYSTYEALLFTAESFADRAQPMVAEFTARGLAATFVTDLRALITAFRAATDVKHGGRADRSAGTAGLAATAAAGMKIVRMLRPLMRVHLKADPALLAAWNLAARVERPPKRAKTEEPPVENPPATTPSGS